MKYSRKLWLFSLHRRQRQFLLIIGLFLTSVLGFLLLNQNLSSNDLKITALISDTSASCYCSKSSLVIFDHGECFFDQLVCYPGFVGERCEIQLKNEV
jgi:hypothetical protein